MPEISTAALVPCLSAEGPQLSKEAISQAIRELDINRPDIYQRIAGVGKNDEGFRKLLQILVGHSLKDGYGVSNYQTWSLCLLYRAMEIQHASGA